MKIVPLAVLEVLFSLFIYVEIEFLGLIKEFTISPVVSYFQICP
jgi:hypothetical protein